LLPRYKEQEELILSQQAWAKVEQLSRVKV